MIKRQSKFNSSQPLDFPLSASRKNHFHPCCCGLDPKYRQQHGKYGLSYVCVPDFFLRGNRKDFEKKKNGIRIGVKVLCPLRACLPGKAVAAAAAAAAADPRGRGCWG